jgi:hypothetical protein
VRTDGAAIVTRAQGMIAGGSALPKRAFAAVRPAGAGAFGAPEAVADPDIASPPPSIP